MVCIRMCCTDIASVYTSRNTPGGQQPQYAESAVSHGGQYLRGMSAPGEVRMIRADECRGILRHCSYSGDDRHGVPQHYGGVHIVEDRHGVPQHYAGLHIGEDSRGVPQHYGGLHMEDSRGIPQHYGHAGEDYRGVPPHYGHSREDRRGVPQHCGHTIAYDNESPVL